MERGPIRTANGEHWGERGDLGTAERKGSLRLRLRFSLRQQGARFQRGFVFRRAEALLPPAEAGGLSRTCSRGARMGNGVCAAVAFWRYG
jgi:hypothetical protein